MKNSLERLWKEYFAEECATINTEEGKALLKKAVEKQKAVKELLTKEQREATEQYVEALYDIQGYSLKKTFFNGCEFAVSFLLEIGKLGEDRE